MLQPDLFKEPIVKVLQEKLDASVVKTREQGGTVLSYVEGWYIQDRLNQVFGFGNWDQEIITLDEVLPLQQIQKNGRDMYRCVYRCVMRLTLTPTYVQRDSDEEDGKRIYTQDLVVREDVGTGSGFSSDPALAIDSAIKEAATDALKRAAKSLGNTFGLALYDKAQTNVKTLEETQAEKWIEQQLTTLETFHAAKNNTAIAAWVVTNEEGLRKRAVKMPSVADKINALLETAHSYAKAVNE